MAETLEKILISVWRQALVEGARTVTVGNKSFPVRRTSRSRLREVDFQFEDHELRGLEQNPKTTSRWARLAREGKKVMQFLGAGRYIAVVVDGRVQFYGKTGLYELEPRVKRRALAIQQRFRRIELTPGRFCDGGFSCRECPGTGTGSQCGSVAECRAVR